MVNRPATMRWSTAVLIVSACLTTGCAHGRSARSYLPVGASAQYGANTNDGVTWTVARPVELTVDSLTTILQTAGYQVDERSASTRGLRTMPRVVGGDTALVVRAQFIAVELPAPGTSIVLTATYSIPSRQVRDAPVFQRKDTTDPLYARLLAIAATARRPAPK